MASDVEENPLEQLVELLVYAPIGLLYEYPDVLAQLIRRGKSQVQLAKFAGQLALKQNRQNDADGERSATTVSPDLLVEGLARLVTEFGSMVGLAPPKSSHTAPSDGGHESDAETSPSAAATTPSHSANDRADGVADDAKPEPTIKLPIANYDELTAKEVVFLLEDLTASQLSRVRHYEHENRNRKTVLAKISRLSA